MTAKSEIDAIDPQSDLYVFEDGFEVRVAPLRTRQLLKLMRIITHGAAPIFDDVASVILSGDEGEVGGRLVGLMLFAVPEAEDETLEFLRSMVTPSTLSSGTSANSLAKNQEAVAELDARMENPSLNDVFGLVRLIITRESGELANLGKQLTAALTAQSETQEPPQEETPEKPSAKAASPNTSKKSSKS